MKSASQYGIARPTATQAKSDCLVMQISKCWLFGQMMKARVRRALRYHPLRCLQRPPKMVLPVLRPAPHRSSRLTPPQRCARGSPRRSGRGEGSRSCGCSAASRGFFSGRPGGLGPGGLEGWRSTGAWAIEKTKNRSKTRVQKLVALMKMGGGLNGFRRWFRMSIAEASH